MTGRDFGPSIGMGEELFVEKLCIVIAKDQKHAFASYNLPNRHFGSTSQAFNLSQNNEREKQQKSF